MNSKNPQTLTIGIDLGGTNLRLAAYTPSRGIIGQLSLRTRLEAGPVAVVEDICEAIAELRQTHGQGLVWSGVGIGSPGPLELPAGRLHHPPNLPGWDGFELRREIESRLGESIVLEGDANAAAFAEFSLGLGKQMGVDSFCMLTLGTGVGNGIVLNGKLWHGANGMGGEAGHIVVDPDGPSCGCGSHGCLESIASATGIARQAEQKILAGAAPGLKQLREQLGAPLTALDLARAAHAGDSDARAVYDATGRAIGLCLAALINTLNLPLYVVGGGVVESWDLLEPALFRELEQRSYVYALTAPGKPAASQMTGGGTRVMPAKLGAEAGLLGACILPLQNTGISQNA